MPKIHRPQHVETLFMLKASTTKLPAPLSEVVTYVARLEQQAQNHTKALEYLRSVILSDMDLPETEKEKIHATVEFFLLQPGHTQVGQ